MIKLLGQIDKFLTKEQIVLLAKQDFTNVITNTKFNLPKTLIELKRYSIYLDAIMEELRLHLSENEPLNESFPMGKILTIKRNSFDYRKDKTWLILNKSIDDTKIKLKQHQLFLKELKEAKVEYVNEQTGEIIEYVKPTIKQSKIIVLKVF
jgi:hypothetical protein